MKKGVLSKFSSSDGVIFHLDSLRRLFTVVFPSEAVVPLERLFCFVFVQVFGNCAYPRKTSHARDPLMMSRPPQPLPDALQVLRICFPHYFGLYLFGTVLTMFTKVQK